MQLNKALFTTSILASTGVNALGINCRGNSNCGGTLCSLYDIQNIINGLSDTASYGPGEHIACCGDIDGTGPGLCAFTQSTSRSITGQEAKGLIAGLAGHNCKKCGSIPFQDNNVAEGQLTVNVSTIHPTTLHLLNIV
ncbi:killer toxin [Hypoxylon sp. FL0543]|nr:killer toxin [Hypoxylon sp. FL0543]